MDYIHPLLDRYDFSEIIRDLVRDGIKYRTEPKVMASPVVGGTVLQSNTPAPAPSLQGIKLGKAEVRDEDLEDRLDSF